MTELEQKALLFDAVRASLTRARGDIYLSICAVKGDRYSEEWPAYHLYDELQAVLSQIERAMSYVPDPGDMS